MLKTLLPLVEGFCPIIFDTKDPQTMVYGLVKRVLKDPPSIDDSLMAEFKIYAFDYINELAANQSTMRWDKQFINKINLIRRRLDQIESAFDKTGLNLLSLVYAYLVFGKKDLFFKAGKSIRLIFPHGDDFNVLFWEAVQLVSEVIYSQPYSVKGLTSHERMERILRFPKSGLFLQTDISKMESSYSSSILDIECYLFCKLLPEFKWVWIEMCRTFSGFKFLKSHSFTAKVKNRRMSGEMTTALTHLIINYCLSSFVAKKSGVQLLDFIGEGDDGLMSLSGKLNLDIYSKLGFDFTAEYVQSLFDTKFCHMIISPDGTGVVRDPVEVILKLRVCHTQRMHSNSKKIQDGLVLAKALSYINEYRNCPIIVPYCLAIIKAYQGTKPIFEWDGYHHYCRSLQYDVMITDVTRSHFERHFGIPAKVQILIEDELARMTDFATPLLASVFDRYSNSDALRAFFYDHKAH